MRKDRFVLVLAAAAVAAVLIYGAENWRLATEERNITRVTDATVHELSQDNPVIQEVIVSQGRYAGVIIYSGEEKLAGQRIEIKVTSRGGQQVKSMFYTSEYWPGSDWLRLKFATPALDLKKADHVFVELKLLSGPAIKLLVSKEDSDTYKEGFLQVGDQKTKQDISLSMLIKQPLPEPAKQGMKTGAIFLLGLSLINFLPKDRQRWIAAVLLVVIITPVALSGYWFSPDKLGVADWDYYFSLHHYYRESILKHHAFPFWNPYTCGGTAGLADPEFPGFTPTFLLELIFGIPAGARLAIFFATATGALGMMALGKRIGLSPQAALLAAVAGYFGTVNLLEITEGHVNVFASMWIPWIFWSWLGVYRGRTRPIVCGLFLAAAFYQAGIYLLMYTALAFIVMPLLAGSPKRAILATIKSGLWALGFAALKLIPVLLWLKQFPDESYASSAFTLPWLTEILFGRHLHGEYVIYKQDSGWHEYGAYIGYLVLGTAVVSLSMIRRHRIIRGLVVAAVLAALVSSGGPLLKPVFDQLPFFPRSNISRLILFSVLPTALLAGFGIDRLRRIPKGHWLTLFIVGLAAVDLFSLSSQLSAQAFVLPDVYPIVEPVPEPIAFTNLHYDTRGTGDRTTRSYAAAKRGWGTINYCSVLGPTPMVRTIHDEGDNGAVSIRDPEGQIQELNWSPNKVSFTALVPKRTEVMINTNYVKGWYVNGEAASNIDARVGTIVEAGTHQITFQYRTPGFVAGLLITIFTFGAALWALARSRQT